MGPKGPNEESDLKQLSPLVLEMIIRGTDSEAQSSCGRSLLAYYRNCSPRDRLLIKHISKD